MQNCKCSSQSSKYCIDKKCKNCCENIKCRRHGTHYCKDCEKLLDNTNKRHILSRKCNKCLNKHLMCTVCNNERYDNKCSFKHCKKCCKEELCNIHLNVNNWCKQCKTYQKICKNNNCVNCYCNNNDCTIHYTNCKNCTTFIEKKKCKHCKECCKNVKCYYHFIQDEDITNKLLNNYKFTLYGIKNLPVCIIDKIVDDFLDVIEECKECHYKFSSFEECCSAGVVFSCENCKEYICDNCVMEHSRYYTIERYCKDCYESSTDDDDIDVDNDDYEYYDDDDSDEYHDYDG